MDVDVTRLRQAWRMVLPQRDQFAERFIAQLKERDELFGALVTRTGEDKAQAMFITHVTAVVNALDDEDELETALFAVGEQLGGLGLKNTHFPTLKETFIAATKETAGDGFTDDLATACDEAFGRFKSVIHRGIVAA